MPDDIPRRRRSDTPLIRYMPLMGYLILAAAVAYAIWQIDRLHDRDIEHSQQQYVEGLRATQRAVYIGCAQRNDAKEAVANILRDFRARAKATGQETEIYDDGLARLGPDDCQALANTVSP